MSLVKFKKTKVNEDNNKPWLIVNKTIKKWIWNLGELKNNFEEIKKKIGDLRNEIKILLLNKKNLSIRIRETIKWIRNEIKQIKNKQSKKE